MGKGFSRAEASAERSLERSTKELKALRKVIEQYKDDPKGRVKMMKKMKKYWRSPLATIKSLDYKPQGKNWELDPTVAADLKAVTEYVDPRNQEDEPETVLTSDQESELRDKLTKTNEAND